MWPELTKFALPSLQICLSYVPYWLRLSALLSWRRHTVTSARVPDIRPVEPFPRHHLRFNTMATPPPAIPPLPDDVLFSIFSRLDNRRCLVSAMLVRRSWYDIAERLQYADIILRFPLFEQAGDRRAARCLRTLATRTTAANAVRHLVVSGTLAGHIITLLLDALRKTTRLISLELQAGNHTDEHVFLNLWQHACNSDQFLPQLCAINTDYSTAAINVARGRPLSALGLPTLIASTLSRAVIDSLGLSSAPVTQLRLNIEVDDMSAALEVLRSICHAFTSLHVISLQLRLPKPADVTWVTFGVRVHLSLCLTSSFIYST